MLTITAIVPTCDRPLLLERALRSIVAQEFLPTEIIVVDDAGEGHENVTRRSLESCCLTGVRVVANANAKGVSGTRNTGAELAAGELLAFLDDDDEWLASYLREVTVLFTSKELDIVCTDLVCRFDDEIDRPGKSAPEILLPEFFLTRNPGLVGSNLIIRKATFREIGGFDESLPACNDIDFGIRLSLRKNVSYGRLSKRLVRIYQYRGKKLGTPGGEAMRAGVRRFYELHAHRMSEAQREEFRRNVRRFWGIDERGQVLELPPSSYYEPLLPFLKARLDQRRQRLNR